LIYLGGRFEACAWCNDSTSTAMVKET
jgi:hypothetical protein